MKYFRINYFKLQNLNQLKYYVVIFVVIFLIIILLLISSLTTVSIKEEFYGLYVDNVLKLKINVKLSDKFKKCKYIVFNDKKTNCKMIEFNDFEIINNEIYQEIDLTIDKKFNNNEVGVVELYYDKKTILKYIFDLFK